MPHPELTAAAAATVLAATAGLAAYAGLSNESQLFGPVLVAPPAPGQLALTFDDGPNLAITPLLLELLARHPAKATFFLIGAHARREPALTREIAAAGHTIGNHTQLHSWLPRHSSAFIRQELTACNQTLAEILGRPVTLFRPPHGARRPAVLRIARSLGLTTVQWNLIVSDWKPIPAATLARHIGQGIAAHRRRGRGTMLVLHDGGQHTPVADRRNTLEAVRLLLASQTPETTLVTPPDWR